MKENKALLKRVPTSSLEVKENKALLKRGAHVIA
jgi:hypothetical protein